MIWQSIFLMTVVDVLILGIVGYSAGVFLVSRGRQAARGSQRGFFAIFGGLSLVALFYLADLLVMHAVPSFMPRAEAMNIMRNLHLNGNWLVTLLGIGSICFGFISLNRGRPLWSVTSRRGNGTSPGNPPNGSASSRACARAVTKCA